MKKLRCKLGIHKWEQSPPSLLTPHKNDKLTRRCLHCGKSQYWLPGYGGQEIGCWLNSEGY